MRARTVAWAVLGATLLVLLGVLVFGGTSETDAERAQRLARSFACPECVGESVAVSNSSTSRRIREMIQEGVDAGDTDDEITARVLATYPGRDLRLEPPRDGLGALVWLAPVGGLLVGFVVIWFAIRRWADTPRLVATPADEQLVARLRRSEATDPTREESP